MRKVVIILSTITFVVSCVGQATKMVENKSSEEAIVDDVAVPADEEQDNAHINSMNQYDLCGSGVVMIYVPKPYYELIVPGLDTIYFCSFDPAPKYEENYYANRSWFSQFYGMSYNEDEWFSMPQGGMGFVVSANGEIVASADLFKVEEVDIESVRKFYMEYASWCLKNKKSCFNKNGEKYNTKKLANLKVEDIQVRKKGGKGDVTVGFFAQQTQERKAGVSRTYKLKSERLKCKLIGCDEYIALVQIENHATPANVHIFDLTHAKKLFVGEELFTFDKFRAEWYETVESLAMRGGCKSNTVAKIDSITQLFNYTFPPSSSGAPIIDVSGNLAGMHLYGYWGEYNSYGIATMEINKRIQQLRDIK